MTLIGKYPQSTRPSVPKFFSSLPFAGKASKITKLVYFDHDPDIEGVGYDDEEEDNYLEEGLDDKGESWMTGWRFRMRLLAFEAVAAQITELGSFTRFALFV
jgi:hypothetical protein